MTTFVCAVLFCVVGTAMAKETVAPPKVQVYSRDPGYFGVANHLICHVSGFHPPTIQVDILKNGEEIPNPKQTDLAFEENWHFHLTKDVPFTPQRGEDYTCRVTHQGKPNTYTWDPDM